MNAKILFPFAENSKKIKYNTVTQYTRFGYVKDGKEFLDTSLGSCGSFMLGFDRTDIVDYVTQRARDIPFVSGEYFSTSKEILELSQKLYDLTGGYYSFYSLSGSDAIEGAVKLSRFYHQSKGNNNKTIVIGVSESYHGSTYLSSSISGGSFMTSILGRSSICETVYRSDDEETLLDNFKEKISTLGADTISCVLMESCSWLGGVTPYSDNFWKKLKLLCKENNILLIIDDIAMCGGKLGKLTGFNIDPDIFTMGKSLSGGYFPLSACLFTEEVYNTVQEKFWSHGFTYSFSLTGIYSTLKYLDIIDKERIFDNYPLLEQNSRNVFDNMVNDGVIESYTSYGLYFNLKFFPVSNIEKVQQKFFDSGLNVGIQNYEWKGLRVIIPLTADADYFYQLESRLRNALSQTS